MLFCVISDKRNHLLHFLEGQRVLGQSVLVAVLPGYHAMATVLFDQVTQPVLLHTVDELQRFTANVLFLVSVLTLTFCRSVLTLRLVSCVMSRHRRLERS